MNETSNSGSTQLPTICSRAEHKIILDITWEVGAFGDAFYSVMVFYVYVCLLM